MKTPKGSAHFYDEIIEEEQDIVITTLNGLPRSWHSFIHGMCFREGSDYLQKTLGKVYKRRISTHNKRRIWEELKIKLSRFKEDPSNNEEYKGLNS